MTFLYRDVISFIFLSPRLQMDDFIAWSNCETCELTEAITTVGSEIPSIQSEQSMRIVQIGQFRPKNWSAATWENMLGVGRGISPSHRHWPLLAGNTELFFIQLLQSTLALWTPRYTLVTRVAAKSPSKNKLQTFDWNKFPLLQTFTIEDTNLWSRGCLQ